MSADGTDPSMVAQRQVLPPKRESITHKFSIMGHEGYLTIGLFEDGRPGEIFIKMAKEGSTLSGLVQAFCRAFSLAIQYGLPLEDWRTAGALRPYTRADPRQTAFLGNQARRQAGGNDHAARIGDRKDPPRPHHLKGD